VIGDSVAAGRLDLIDNLLRRRLVEALTAAAGAGVVDDDFGAVRRHQFGHLGSDSTTRSRAKCDPSVEHAHPSVSLR